MNRTRYLLLLGVAGLLAPCPAIGQPLPGFLNTWTNPGSGVWSSASNWSGANIPDGQGVLSLGDDFALIDNGGQAIVSSSVTQPGAIPGGVGVGSVDGASGTLTIQNGGVLEVLGFAGADADGSVQIGRLASGFGVLDISGNGRLIAESLSTGGAAETAVHFRDTAAVSLSGLANLGRTTRVDGPDVDFSTTGNLQLRGSGTLFAGITGTTHSPLKAAGSATVAGDLLVELNSTPSVGAAWRIVDAGTITGGFDAIDTNVALGVGQSLRQRVTTTGTTFGSALEVFVDQSLVLTVNRDTGGVTIENFGGPLNLDAYSVRSAAGSLSQDDWIQFGSPWQTANPSATNLSELRQVGAGTLASGTVSLGSVYAPATPTEFGELAEDLAFTYSAPGEPAVEGFVQYVGTAGINNLVLVVDPNTGRAQINNTSMFDVSIDAYSIASDSGSLTPEGWTNINVWDGGDEWDEANAEVDRVSELRQAGASLVASGARIDLGMLFDETNGMEDLTFEFLLDSDLAARAGVVVYQAIPDGLPGDYNEDGAVDAADYTVWRNQLGAPTLPNRDPNATGNVGVADYNFWRSNYGASSAPTAVTTGLSVATVPEPATLAVMGLALLQGLILNRRRRD